MNIRAAAAMLAARLKEPSSWAAIAVGLGVIGVHLDQQLWGSVAIAGTGLAGILAFFMPEQS